MGGLNPLCALVEIVGTKRFRWGWIVEFQVVPKGPNDEVFSTAMMGRTSTWWPIFCSSAQFVMDLQDMEKFIFLHGDLPAFPGSPFGKLLWYLILQEVHASLLDTTLMDLHEGGVLDTVPEFRLWSFSVEPWAFDKKAWFLRTPIAKLILSFPPSTKAFIGFSRKLMLHSALPLCRKCGWWILHLGNGGNSGELFGRLVFTEERGFSYGRSYIKGSLQVLGLLSTQFRHGLALFVELSFEDMTHLFFLCHERRLVALVFPSTAEFMEMVLTGGLLPLALVSILELSKGKRCFLLVFLNRLMRCVWNQ
ncbi:hypothetical protein R1flu_019050 [Riccia fluitans]|uniref:Maturase K n=1 Tax=Riccia fluitans TaxID=41844 RepID=A0ABD1ZHU3_9MARC